MGNWFQHFKHYLFISLEVYIKFVVRWKNYLFFCYTWLHSFLFSRVCWFCCCCSLLFGRQSSCCPLQLLMMLQRLLLCRPKSLKYTTWRGAESSILTRATAVPHLFYCSILFSLHIILVFLIITLFLCLLYSLHSLNLRSVVLCTLFARAKKKIYNASVLKCTLVFSSISLGMR